MCSSLWYIMFASMHTQHCMTTIWFIQGGMTTIWLHCMTTIWFIQGAWQQYGYMTPLLVIRIQHSPSWSNEDVTYSIILMNLDSNSYVCPISCDPHHNTTTNQLWLHSSITLIDLLGSSGNELYCVRPASFIDAPGSTGNVLYCLHDSILLERIVH